MTITGICVHFDYFNICEYILYHTQKYINRLVYLLCTRDDFNDSLPYFKFMFGNDITIFLYVRGDVIFLKTEMQHRVSSVHYSLLKCGLM